MIASLNGIIEDKNDFTEWVLLDVKLHRNCNEEVTALGDYLFR